MVKMYSNKMCKKSIILLFLTVSLVACSQTNKEVSTVSNNSVEGSLDTAYFAAGCFWCVEAVFESIHGVTEVISGYAGGKEKNPTYASVSSGLSSHAETVQIVYNPKLVPFDTLLVAFFGSHDPSTLNSQGPDFGPQYRSIVFYQNTQELDKTTGYVNWLLNKKVYSKITTEIVPFEVFYPAEIYHQNYEKNNPNQPYIQRVSKPRVEAFQKKHPTLLKREE
jgi:peptide-methionine (S)-S-oxide reductase